MLKEILQKCSKTEVHFSSKITKKGRIHQQDKPPHTNTPTKLATYNSPIPLAVLSPYYSVTRRSSVPSLQILDPSVIPSHHSILDTQNPPLQMSFSKDKPNLPDTHPCFPSPSFSIAATVASPVKALDHVLPMFKRLIFFSTFVVSNFFIHPNINRKKPLGCKT